MGAASAAAEHPDDEVVVDLGDVEGVLAAEAVLHKAQLRFRRAFGARFALEGDDLAEALFFGAAAEFFDDDVMFHGNSLCGIFNGLHATAVPARPIRRDPRRSPGGIVRPFSGRRRRRLCAVRRRAFGLPCDAIGGGADQRQNVRILEHPRKTLKAVRGQRQIAVVIADAVDAPVDEAQRKVEIQRFGDGGDAKAAHAMRDGENLAQQYPGVAVPSEVAGG